MIRTIIIHFLGGMTETEFSECSRVDNAMERYRNAKKFASYARSLNGCNADEWCKKMFQFCIEEETSSEINIFNKLNGNE